jgi:hypothetical protein
MGLSVKCSFRSLLLRRYVALLVIVNMSDVYSSSCLVNDLNVMLIYFPFL